MGDYLRKMDGPLEKKIMQDTYEWENRYLSMNASKSSEALRRKNAKYPDIRASYSRDSDRIMHTHAYSRYIDKTQVFSLVDNDHITHRVLHVQFVSKIARTIGRALTLNEDLIEAIALGHDIGHVPFGHRGERYLSKICEEKKIGKFLHNVQSVQFLDVIEDCDLSLQVLDGILCHNGEIHEQKLIPNRDKNWRDFDEEVRKIRNEKDKNPAPMTLEGCVVKFSDTIAYMGRDIQDAIEIGLIDNDDDSMIPQICREQIGGDNANIINTLSIDLIENSYDKDYIAYSPETSKIIKEYKDFNNKKIYNNKKILYQEKKIQRMYETLFKVFLEDLEEENDASKIYDHFIKLDWINPSYIDDSKNEEKVRDYIAGMTDRYFESTFREIADIFPTRVRSYK